MPYQLAVRPTRLTPGPEVSTSLNLELLYSPDGESHNLYEVHVSATLQTVLASRSLASVYIEALEASGLASNLLPGEPKWLVLAAQVKGKPWRSELASCLKRARLRRLLLGTFACVLGIGCLGLPPHTWLGAGALVCGSHWLRSRAEIPKKPAKRNVRFFGG
jgi:hypothetical protein